MPTKTNMTIFYVLLGLAFLLWVAMMVTLNQPISHHDFGSAVLGVVAMLALWAVLAALLLMGGMKGEMPRWAVWAAWLLHPASLAASIAVLDARSGWAGPNSWLIVVPTVVPLLTVAYAAWAYLPAFHAAIPAAVAGSSGWGLIFILAVVPWVAMIQHDSQYEAGQAESAKEYVALQAAEARPENLKKLEALTQDSALWEWREFTAPEKGVRDEAFAGIRNLKRRQKDAEEMLAQGVVGFLADLPNLDLQPTPVIVAAHKKYVRDLATGNDRPDAGSVKYSWIANQVDPYLPSIQWMAERHCGCSAEVAALEAVIRRYKNSTGRAECLAALAKALAAEKN